MKPLPLLFLLIFSLSFVSETSAHSNHHHAKKKVSQTTINSKAQKHIEVLIKKKKLPSSWRKATLLSSEKKRFKGRIEWLITFRNANAPDNAKKVLYMFFNVYGNFLAANFTGK